MRLIISSCLIFKLSFAQQITEIDEELRAFSQVEDREQHMRKLTDVIGLRAHLFAELVRIQMMLSENDPQLKVVLVYPFISLSAYGGDILERSSSRSKSANFGSTSYSLRLRSFLFAKYLFDYVI